MGKAQRERSRNAREKIAAQRAMARRAARRRILVAGGSAAVVLAAVIALILTALTRSPAPAAAATSDAAVAQAVTSVPAATFDKVGAGTATGLKQVTGQPALTAGGKPEVLYIGGQYCPFCAAERWALVAALSRFGTFSGLQFMRSSPSDVYANTPTLSFHRSGYASSYLTFVPVEWYSEVPDSSTLTGYAYLQQPSAQQQRLFSKYGGAFPFVDIGNRFFVPQAQYLPSALAGMTWAQVAAAMRDPSSPVGKDIDGAANAITAAICTMTGGRPAAVCASPGVTAARGSI
jgi:hypothetical protein